MAAVQTPESNISCHAPNPEDQAMQISFKTSQEVKNPLRYSQAHTTVKMHAYYGVVLVHDTVHQDEKPHLTAVHCIRSES